MSDEEKFKILALLSLEERVFSRNMMDCSKFFKDSLEETLDLLCLDYRVEVTGR